MKHQSKRVYDRHQREFLAWCEARALDPELASGADIAAYLMSIMPRVSAYGTIIQCCTALDRWYIERGFDLPPTRSESLRKVKRSVTKSPPAGIPFAAVEIERVMAACPSTLSGLRDRALIALTYRLRMRPHVLVKLTVEDCRAFARTAPEIQDWLDAAGITSGFVFRQVKWGHCFGQKPLDAGWVSRAIRLRSSQAGLDPAFRNATSLLREAA